jgi:hypothetical protein
MIGNTAEQLWYIKEVYSKKTTTNHLSPSVMFKKQTLFIKNINRVV